MLASAVTSHYGHHRLCVGYCHTKQIGHLSHGLSTAYRTKESIKASCISPFHEGISHTTTSWESTSTAIGTWQQLADLSNTGILIDSELLGGGKQHNGCYQTDSS
jgi:hypothetical protein